MNNTFYSALASICVFLSVSVIAQDTTFVQTFTFDDITKRRDVYEFPAATETYSKVLMYKTLKCDAATTQDNYPCGEWDYLTYTYVYDHTGQMDSNAASHPKYLAAGNDFTTISSHNIPMYDGYQWMQSERSIDSVISETAYTFNSGSTTTANALASNQESGRFQFIIPASELTNAGLSADTIDRLSFDLSTLGSALGHLTIRLRNYTFSSLDQMEDFNMTTVYEQNTSFNSTGAQTLNLTNDFAWNGTSNLLVEISFTTGSTGTANVLSAETQNDTLGLYASGGDGYVEFSENRNRIEVPLNGYDFGDEITVSFWSYGDPEIMPVNCSLFEAYDENGIRALNSHLPWSNGSVYWDAGSGSGYDRISKAASAGDYEGAWNHWAMTKNAATGSMKIYLNGNLWQSGNDKNRTLGLLDKLIIGSAMNNNPYYGKVDEFRIWKKELAASEINDWMYDDVTSSHPNYSDLALYLQFDDGYNLTNEAPSSIVAYWHGAPDVKTYSGTEIFRKTTRTNVIPEIQLIQGDYLDSTTVTTQTDTRLQKPLSIVEYAIVGNHIEAIAGSYVSPEGYSYTYNSNGQAIDSTYYSGTQTWTNSVLNYFEAPFEVVDRYEIGRFITPYGIGLSLGPKGFTWVYDVTDYAHLLRDSVDIRCGNQQELLDLEFAFIHGTPPANVVELTRPWGQSGSKSYSALDTDGALEPIEVSVHPSAKRQKVIARLTGHGHQSNSGSFPHCCEWKDNTHYLFVDGSQATDWHIWQTHDCALNPVYPQGGTWPGAREGWCPGDVVKDYEYDITSLVSGTSYELDYDITPVPSGNAGMGSGNYIVAMHVIQYDEPANALDAEIYDVIAPSNRGYYSRKNPVCFAPKVVIRNNGSTPLTSLKIVYKVSGGIQKVYNWSGYLGFLEKEEVELPFQDGAFYLGDGSNVFHASVLEPNGGVDGNTANDLYKSKFELPEVLQGQVIIQYKTNTNVGENDLILYNSENVPIVAKYGFSLDANTIYWDTLDLDTGCYRLEITDSEDDGLSYWAWPNQGTGSLNVWNDGGIAKSFESEFGNKVEYAFAVGAMTTDTVKTLVNDIPVWVIGGDSLILINGEYVALDVDEEAASDFQLNVYPNPNAGSFYLEMLSFTGTVNMDVYDLSGQLVYSERLVSYGDFAKKFNLKLSTGMYMIHLNGQNMNETLKIAVER